MGPVGLIRARGSQESRVLAHEIRCLAVRAPMYVLRVRFAKVEEGEVGSLEAEIEARRKFAGESPVLQEAMRVRLRNCAVVEIHGLGDVAIKAGKFGSDQELHMRIRGRGVPGPCFKARETLSYLLNVAFAGRVVRVSGGSCV